MPPGSWDPVVWVGQATGTRPMGHCGVMGTPQMHPVPLVWGERDTCPVGSCGVGGTKHEQSTSQRGNGDRCAPTLCDSHCLGDTRHASTPWDLGGTPPCTQPIEPCRELGNTSGSGMGAAAGPLPWWGLSQLTSTCLAPSWWTWSRGRWTACARVPSATSSALTTSSLVGPRVGAGAPFPGVPPAPPSWDPPGRSPSPGHPGHTPPAPRGPALPARRQTSAVPASHPAPASDLPGAAGWSQP